MVITPEITGGLTTSGRANAGKWLHALYRADKKEGFASLQTPLLHRAFAWW
jgi:hypothetical protein